MPRYEKRKVKKVSPKKPAAERAAARKATAPAWVDENDVDVIPMQSTARLRREKKAARAGEKAVKKKAARGQLKKKKPNKRASAPTPTENRSSFRVVEGGGKKKKGGRIFFAVCFVLVLFIVAAQLITPTGLVEFLQNRYAAMGSGSGYPASLSGNRFLAVYPMRSHTAVLSDTYLEVYNQNGGEILTAQHGFSNPAASVSEERILVYDLTGKGIKVYNLTTLLYDEKLDETIYAGAVGTDGTVALATSSTGYAAQVSVRDKNNKLLYTWYSPEEMIAGVALSPNGKRLAVAAFAAKDGALQSNIYIFRYNSATPVATIPIADDMAVSLLAGSSGRFTAVTNRSVMKIKWSNAEYTEFAYDGELRYIKQMPKGETVLCMGRHNDPTLQQVAVLDHAGEQVASFAHSGAVQDVSYQGGTVYLLGEDQLYGYDLSGVSLSQIACGYDVKLILGLTADKVNALQGNKLVQFDLNGIE